MNTQLKKLKLSSRNDENSINDLSAEIYSLISNYEANTENDFVFEKNDDLFIKICNRAKESLQYSNEKFDKEKLCYMVAVYVLKSGLFYLLERAYKNGFDFEDL